MRRIAPTGSFFAPLRIDWPRAAYSLAMPQDERRRCALSWLILGLAALLGSGVFSILLVVARTPFLQQLLPGTGFFHVALVTHVDLSVLVWFGAFAGVLWTIAGGKRWMTLAWVAFGFAALGTAVIVIAPFRSAGATPIMSNYVPVLDDPLFLYGLVMFGLGLALLALRSLLAGASRNDDSAGAEALRFGLNAAAVAMVVTFVALAWSFQSVPQELTGKAYYELLFWGAGHAVQFAWTLLLLVAWLWLAALIRAPLPISPRVVLVLFAIALASVFAVPLVYAFWDVVTVEHQRLQTWLMRFGGGLAIPPVVAALIVALVRTRQRGAEMRPLQTALVTSIVLFGAGGAIGFMIQGSDVRVPAHYHGMIVGITLAFMGLTYGLLPSFGGRAPVGRCATWQPILYGGGQLMHIAGLVWSGGYGVQRKVAGASQVLHGASEIVGMTVMGIGGLAAIAGGVLFLIVAIGAMRGRRGAV